MSNSVIAVLATIIISLLAILYSVLMWNSRRSPRYLMRGIGIVIAVVGLLLLGLFEQIVKSVIEFIRWANKESMDTVMWIGLALMIIGALLFVFGGLIKPPTRAEIKAQKAEDAAKAANKLLKTSTTQPTPAPVSRPVDPNPTNPTNTDTAS